MSQTKLTQDGLTASTVAQRPKRNKKLSLRAQENLDAGESIPGLHLRESRSPSTDSNDQFENLQTPTNMASRKDQMASLRREREDIPRAESARFRGVRPSDFPPEKFAIYFWEYPRPKDFLNLSDSRKAWKQKTDAQEAANDDDDGSDDWHEFSGNSDQRVVARAFVNRAKRAFWAGSTWDEFEELERCFNSEDFAAHWQTLSEQLNNGFRLEVFDALKRRLCEEIWLQPYRDPAGLVRLPMPRKDSKVADVDETGQGSTVAHPTRPTRAPTADEAERGVKGWSCGPDGIWEPFYEGEEEAPHGMDDLMDYWRGQTQKKGKDNTGRATEGSVRSEASSDKRGGDGVLEMSPDGQSTSKRSKSAVEGDGGD